MYTYKLSINAIVDVLQNSLRERLKWAKGEEKGMGWKYEMMLTDVLSRILHDKSQRETAQ